MNPEDRQKMIDSLDRIMREREQSRERLNASLREFSSRLFAALEKALAEMTAHNTPGLGKSRRLAHPSGGSREGLEIAIEDWSIIFVPMLSFARPNPEDEARIPPYQFKELCGRIAVFLTNDPQGIAFYDFIILQDQSWFAWGYGWPKQQDAIEHTDFEALAWELLHSFTRDITQTWNTRLQTTLASALDPKQRGYTFGLPGDERHGG